MTDAEMFFQRITENPEFALRIASSIQGQQEEAAVSIIVSIANEAEINIGVTEATAFLTALKAELMESSELSDGQLDNVAGGLPYFLGDPKDAIYSAVKRGRWGLHQV